MSSTCERAENGQCQQRFFHLTSFYKNSLEDPYFQSDAQTLMLLILRDFTFVYRSNFLDEIKKLKWHLLYFFIGKSVVGANAQRATDESIRTGGILQQYKKNAAQ
ncbi:MULTISPECIES: hypothetical protein [unclassified Herbaspirillum]|uniref:hypothetical protein n=1 Tax=unclassified Herbaspirillum TaxID=2624150 RepID=UPI00161360DB|nr:MULTISPECIES: hypothetical protein [unclassified Herbaspirillum]MBB5390300.1 hypothetical protein [Herbaspirillum sp. SJZ102]